MVETGELSKKIFALLKGNGLKIKIFDDSGSSVTDDSLGRRFFILDPNIMVTINSDNNTVEFNKGANVDGETVEDLQKSIRHLADEFMMNSSIKVFGKAIQPRDYSYQAKKKDRTMNENTVKPVNHYLLGQVLHKIKFFKRAGAYTLADDLGVSLSEIQPILNRLVATGKIQAENYRTGEPEYVMAVEDAITESLSRMFGSARTSQQTLENVRILVKHKTPVDESIRGSRSRHISAIFLECNDERFRFQYNYLPGARAMAQHMSHGGLINDKIGTYINESVGQLLKLQSFNRYVTTNKLINEGSSDIIETIKENIQTLRTELKKFIGAKTYETIKARLETFEREPLAEDDTTQLKDLFTIRRFDEKFEEVLPIVKRLVQEKNTYNKRIEEAAANIVRINSREISTTPIFEFASDYARIGFMLNEFALRIVENEELAGFVNKIGTKLFKEGKVNDFEYAVMTQIFENLKVEEESIKIKKDIKESLDIDTFFDKFILNFF